VIAVQINGKLRSQIEIAAPPDEQRVMDAVFASDKVQGYISGKEIVKKIYVPGKLVNLVVR
jgi:leucyl-tRNA synthetase